MKTQRLIVTLIVAPLVLVACGGSDDGSSSGGSTSPADLNGTWVLDGSSIDALSADAPSGTDVTITFADGNANGSAGCNTFSGSYEAADDGSLTFGPLASTMMACDDPVMTLETAYLGALGNVSSFSVEGDLTLSAGSMTLTYAADSGS
jgi:heat shock protein HslJ